MKRKLPSDAGVSLLELLLSLVILSMIAVAITSMLGLGTRVWDVAGRMGGVTERALARNQLRELLETMPLPNAHLPGAMIFEGRQDGISFRMKEAPDNPEDLTTYAVSAIIAHSGQNLRLTLTSETETHPSSVEVALSQATIRYYGNPTPREAPAWHQDWTGLSRLPALVRIDFTATNGRFIPPLAIQPAKQTAQRVISLSSLIPPG